ncbi:hypothetical protein TNCV_4239611 [Trichonephila clavipes]|nr:hypothetical protein TNCV_4239611 [Trichonephila clavipes]
MTSQPYVHDIMQPHVLSLMSRLPGAIFQQDNVRPHTAKVSQDYLHTVTVLRLVWCGSKERGVPAQVSSTSLDHGSKLRGPSPKALV